MRWLVHHGKLLLLLPRCASLMAKTEYLVTLKMIFFYIVANTICSLRNGGDKMLISHYCSFRTAEHCSCGIIACLHFCLNINMTILTFKLGPFCGGFRC